MPRRSRRTPSAAPGVAGRMAPAASASFARRTTALLCVAWGAPRFIRPASRRSSRSRMAPRRRGWRCTPGAARTSCDARGRCLRASRSSMHARQRNRRGRSLFDRGSFAFAVDGARVAIADRADAAAGLAAQSTRRRSSTTSTSISSRRRGRSSAASQRLPGGYACATSGATAAVCAAIGTRASTNPVACDLRIRSATNSARSCATPLHATLRRDPSALSERRHRQLDRRRHAPRSHRRARADVFDRLRCRRVRRDGIRAHRRAALRHRPPRVLRHAGRPGRRRFPRSPSHYDQPFGNSSAVPAYFCAKLAREDGVSECSPATAATSSSAAIPATRCNAVRGLPRSCRRLSEGASSSRCSCPGVPRSRRARAAKARGLRSPCVGADARPAAALQPADAARS